MTKYVLARRIIECSSLSRFYMIKKIFVFSICLFCSFLPALGGLFVNADVLQNWYASLNKPSFTPPDWFFGPAWGVLYLLTGIVLYILYTAEINSKDKKILLLFFAAQAALNFLWVPAFFGARAVLLSLCIIILMTALCVDFVIKAFNVKPILGYLFLPYVIWLLYAFWLNAGVYVLT